ncbi:hypothetical protein [Streptomyces sp. CA-132043]|uniref:hypothetical protein n=1 Tax=Streptomyces sp. CA-132043 TaxID=3240048 RepID=UPI003D8FD049
MTARVPGNAYPIHYRPADERFTDDLVDCIAAALAAGGYPPVRTPLDRAGLEMALLGFLYETKEIS